MTEFKYNSNDMRYDFYICENTAKEKRHNVVVSRKSSGTGSCIGPKCGWTHMDGWNILARIFYYSHVLHLMYLNPPLDIDRQASRINYVNNIRKGGYTI